MSNFDTARNGYEKKQVDLYINDMVAKLNFLNTENGKLKNQIQVLQNNEKQVNDKNESISIALTAAVEKAKQIEKSSENVYKLKIQQLNLLYEKWERLLNEIIDKNPQLENSYNVKELLDDFRNGIKSTLKEDFKMVSTTAVQTDNDTIRLLLGKLASRQKEQKMAKLERRQLPKDMLSSETELKRIEDKSPLIKPICNAKFDKNDKFEDLADKFLTEKVDESSAYSNIITSKASAIPDVNESGFDLKEAINPKDDLDEIMKAFDFFKQDDK